MSNCKRFFVCLILIPKSAFAYTYIPRMDGHSSFSKGVKNKQTTNSKLQTFGLSLNMSNSKRFFVCLILIPKSAFTYAYIPRMDGHSSSSKGVKNKQTNNKLQIPNIRSIPKYEQQQKVLCLLDPEPAFA